MTQAHKGAEERQAILHAITHENLVFSRESSTKCEDKRQENTYARMSREYEPAEMAKYERMTFTVTLALSLAGGGSIVFTVGTEFPFRTMMCV